MTGWIDESRLQGADVIFSMFMMFLLPIVYVIGIAVTVIYNCRDRRPIERVYADKDPEGANRRRPV